MERGWRHMLRRQAKAEIRHSHKKDDHRCGKEFLPLFLPEQNRAPQEEEDQPGFLAQGAEKE
jgi:hypothetical protein